MEEHEKMNKFWEDFLHDLGMGLLEAFPLIAIFIVLIIMGIVYPNWWLN